jgi:spermidine synthase
LLKSYSSELNPRLDVRLLNGKKVLDSEQANLAWGGLHILFQKTFQQIKFDKERIKNVLLLGFGAGGVAHILQKELEIDCSITGIEIDKTLIEISKEHFDFDQLKKIEIIIADANEFLKKNSFQYDLIVVDLFFDIQIPDSSATDSFRKNLIHAVAPGGWLVYNFIARLMKQKKAADLLVNSLSKENGIGQQLKPHGDNTVVVWHRN